MALWHGYFGMENLSLNVSRKAALVAALKALGPGEDAQPARLNHWRVRLDGEAVIFEALFNTDHLTVAAFKNRLGVIFGVDPEDIEHTVYQADVGAVVAFSYGGTAYLRVVFFGYDGANWPDWETSREAAQAYIAAYLGYWEESEDV
jgi:hypothetical protein